MNVDEINEFFDNKRMEMLAKNQETLKPVQLPDSYDSTWYFSPLMEAERVEIIEVVDQTKDDESCGYAKIDMLVRAKNSSGKRMFTSIDEIKLVCKKMLIWPTKEVTRMMGEIGKLDDQVSKINVEDMAGNLEQTDTNTTSAQ